jgi:DNA invertase Pin-like site-specific DNA recombinase
MPYWVARHLVIWLPIEKQWEGITRAKAEGKFKGRVPKARAKQSEIQRLAVTDMKPTQIVESLRVSHASIYRYLSA